MIKISVANQKGGVGKTTIVFHLAHVWAGQGKKVLCVDMDPQGNLSSSFCPEGIPEKSLVSAVFKKKRPEVIQTNKGIYLAASDISLSVHEKDLSLKNYFCLKYWLDSVKNFDVVLIDTPPSLGLFTVNALTAANWVIAPVDISVYAIRALTDLQNSLKELSGVTKSPKLLGVVLSSFTKFHRSSRAIKEHLDEEYQDLLFSTIIPNSTKAKEALILGAPVWKIKGDVSKIEKSFRALSREVLSRIEKRKRSR
ncbi:MAG: ParA family protein [Candidatus Omnitrophota bacterium]